MPTLGRNGREDRARRCETPPELSACRILRHTPPPLTDEQLKSALVVLERHNLQAKMAERFIATWEAAEVAFRREMQLQAALEIIDEHGLASEFVDERRR